MGFYFRKSKSLGGGLRLNFSKNGIGISGGVKGARLSLGPGGLNFYGSIPGTGVYYRKKLSGSNRVHRNNNSRGGYSRTIVNEYTGETRTVRANSQWELDELVRSEEARMEANELRIRRNEEIQSQRERAAFLTEQAENVIDDFKHLISASLSVDDCLNWDEQLILDEFPDFEYDESTDVDKETALRTYLQQKDEFEQEKREHNADVNFLRSNFEFADSFAIEKYAAVVLANSRYPSDLELDFDVSYNAMASALIVSILFPDLDDFPTTERFEYDMDEGIVEVKMSRDKAESFYEKTLLAVALRTIHELYEAIYNDSVNIIVVTGYLQDGEVTEFDEDDENIRPIFRINADYDSFRNISINDDNVEDVLGTLDMIRTNSFTDRTEKLQED